MDAKIWMTKCILLQQEQEVKSQSESTFGLNKNGFCDFAIDGIELLIQGIHYLRNTDDTLDGDGNYKNFNMAIRTYSFYHFYRTIFQFKAIYNLWIVGYYTEAAILLRSIFEALVKLKYLKTQENVNLINLAFVGHTGIDGEKFRVTNKTMFDSISEELYDYYRLLCDMTHGTMAGHLLKSQTANNDAGFVLDIGVSFRENESSFITNQFAPLLLAHLEFMFHIFPEIRMNMDERYASKYHEVISVLYRVMNDFKESPKNYKWYSTISKLIRFI